jgi:hypothetical protein
MTDEDDELYLIADYKEFLKDLEIIDLEIDHGTYIHTYHSRFIPEGLAEISQIILRDTLVLPTLVSYEEYCRRDRW